MDIAGLFPAEKSNRVDSGTGAVYERTAEFGDTVIVIHNIGAMTLMSTEKPIGPLIAAILLVLSGLFLLQAGASLGILLLLVGGALAYWWGSRKPENYLSIGTSDGNRVQLVSKDRQFLIDVRAILRGKLDRNSLETASINISAGTIAGGIALGANSSASGHGGSIHVVGG